MSSLLTASWLAYEKKRGESQFTKLLLCLMLYFVVTKDTSILMALPGSGE